MRFFDWQQLSSLLILDRKGFIDTMRSVKTTLLMSLVASAAFVAASGQLPQPDGGPMQRGTLPRKWATGGPKCMEMPEWQVHECNPDLFILRQSGCTDYEKPFLYLLFGQDRAMLLDTGSRNGNLAPELDRLVRLWLKRNSRNAISVLVVHTHAHSDHTAGDKDLQALHDPDVQIDFIPAELEATKHLYHITNWPVDTGSVDLGKRIVDVIPIPGHSALSVAFYDRNTAILFSGDSLYPGRLYVDDFPAFQASTERMIRFTEGKPVAEILGNHIEETRTPYLDYPVGTIYQPDEHELQLSRGSLLELEDALKKLNGKPTRVALRDFTIWPDGPVSYADRLAFKERQQKQAAAMWDQTQPQ